MSDGRVPRGQEAICSVRSAAQVRVWQLTERSRKLIAHENWKEPGWGLQAVYGGLGGPWIVRSTSEGPENAELGWKWTGGHCEVRAQKNSGVPRTAQNSSDTIVLTIILPPNSKYNPPPLPKSRVVLDSWVVSQIWLDSDSTELSQSWVGRENPGYESSQSRIMLIVIWVRVESTGYCLSQSCVTDFSKRKRQDLAIICNFTEKEPTYSYIRPHSPPLPVNNIFPN